VRALNATAASATASLRGLPHIVLHEESHQGIGIEPDDFADAPRLAIAWFISAMDTGFRGLPNMPFNLVTDRVAAMNS
jgi:hypothetical protein